MPVLCRTVIDWLEEWAPPLLAEPDDHIGLQVGAADTAIEKLLVTLDVTPEVAEEAVREKVQLIVSHHPLIRDPLANLNYDALPASLAVRLVESRIHLYVAHTNMDAAPGGVNDILAERLGLIDAAALRPSGENLYKLTVFVPRGYEEAVRQAICAAGAGRAPSGRGNYSECTFRTAGWGTFRPLPGADPFLGKVGELQKVREIRLETVVPEHRLATVVETMLDSHPYEEVAYDIHLLKNQSGRAGLGRLGRLEAARPLRAFAEQVRDALGLQGVRLVGDPGRSIERVALCSGAGMALIPRAARMGADVFVTGDVKHHEALKALELGIAVIDAGHHGTERVVVPAMAEYLAKKAAAAGERLEIKVSGVHTDPFVSLYSERRQAPPAASFGNAGHKAAAAPPSGRAGPKAAVAPPSGNAGPKAAAAPPSGGKGPKEATVPDEWVLRSNERGTGHDPGNRKRKALGDAPGAVLEREPGYGPETTEQRVSGNDPETPDRRAPGKLIIYIDGASRGNPGLAGVGVVILDELRQPVAEETRFLGSATNNVAEYQALIIALQVSLELGADQVEIRTDSQLLARQWSGAYRVQSPGLAPLMEQARLLAGRLRSCKIVHVPREHNRRADALANRAIDEHLVR